MSQSLEIEFSKKKGLLVRCPATHLMSYVSECVQCEYFGQASIGKIICKRFTVVKGVLLDGKIPERQISR